MQVTIVAVHLDTGDQDDLVLLAPQITGTVRAALAPPPDGRGRALPMTVSGPPTLGVGGGPAAPVAIAAPAPAAAAEAAADPSPTHWVGDPPAAPALKRCAGCGQPREHLTKKGLCRSCCINNARARRHNA